MTGKTKTPESSADLLRLLDELLDAASPLDLEDADAELRAVGLDPEKVGRHLARVAEDAFMHSPLNWRVRARRDRERALHALDRRKTAEPRPRADVEAKIDAILAHYPGIQGAPALRAHFHKLQGTATEEELSSLLTELEFLRDQLKDTEGEG